jgi:hypothetical protein
MTTFLLLLALLALGYAAPAFLFHLLQAPPRSRMAALSLAVVVLALLVPTLAFAAPWYERDPFVMPIGYLLTGAAIAAGAWLTGLFAKGQKADIANANQALAESLEAQLRGLMLQAVAAVEERTAKAPHIAARTKRDEAMSLFRQSLPAGVSVPMTKANDMLDATLALSGKFGATARKG